MNRSAIDFSSGNVILTTDKPYWEIPSSPPSRLGSVKSSDAGVFLCRLIFYAVMSILSFCDIFVDAVAAGK